MKLYDDIINNLKSLIAYSEPVSLSLGNAAWPLATDHSMILRNDMAYEFGSQSKKGLGITLITDDKTLVTGDGLFLCGKDIQEIKEDSDYARIAIIRVKSESLGEGNALYNGIRKLEYTRYHFYPEGFMMRVSSLQNKESVRISKEAIKKGIDFSKIGNCMIREFKKQSVVEAVQLYYITDPAFDYVRLEKLANQGEVVTKTIDHILKDVKMDCNACNLKKICDEIDGLRELHFAQQR